MAGADVCVLIKGRDVDPDAHRTTPRGPAGRDGGRASTGQGPQGKVAGHAQELDRGQEPLPPGL